MISRIGLAAVAACLALAGCDTLETTRIGRDGGDLPEVRIGTVNDTVVPPARSLTTLAVRTFVPGTGEGAWDEVPGAICTIRGGAYYRVTVRTPVRLRVPDLGPDAPALVADCSLGNLAGRAEVAPWFTWPRDGHADPVRRAAWGQGWWLGFRKSGPMGYGDLAIALRPVPPGTRRPPVTGAARAPAVVVEPSPLGRTPADGTL